MSYPTEKLGNHIQVLSGFAFKSKDFSDAGIPVIKIKNITPPSVSLIDLSYVSEEIADKNEKFILRYNDVLIALTGSHINQMASVVGRVAKVKYDEKTVLNQRVGKIIVNDSDDCDLDFVYYYLSQDKVKIELASKAGGAANQANISPTDIKNLIIPFPEITVQRKISAILRTYDDLIENNQKQIKLLEEAAQRLYKEWFVDLRFPGHEATPIVDGLPERWKQGTINSIIELQSGFAFKSADFCDSGTYKVVTIKNVQDGRFDGKNVSRIDDIPARMPDHCRLNDGDILLSLTGNVGRVCVVNGQDYLLNQRVAKIKSDYPAYAYCLFRSSDMFTSMGNLANGAAQQNLSPIKTGQIKILIPPVSLLMRFEEITSAYMKQMLTLNKQIELLQQARDRLLPKLMSGEIEV